MLSLITFLPLLGVAAILLTREFAGPTEEDRDGAARMIALVTTAAVLALSLLPAEPHAAAPSPSCDATISW